MLLSMHDTHAYPTASSVNSAQQETEGAMLVQAITLIDLQLQMLYTNANVKTQVCLCRAGLWGFRRSPCCSSNPAAASGIPHKSCAFAFASMAAAGHSLRVLLCDASLQWRPAVRSPGS